MDAFSVVGDPVRRRILELLAESELSSGAMCEAIQAEFKISQPAVSQHLKVLRDAGLASVRAVGAKRLYSIEVSALREIDTWLDRFRAVWEPRLDALATEVARGKRDRRRDAGSSRSDTARSAS
ncbi:metalloregulator ArsR/SmtB family transcription factor [Nocardioidaceae bacterium SCSIO 66511]|nr:metalloregulator ArsR/SmtB family transcription factor [Nocardioidaceae bacterium SCSIO 66511]